jgi:hypothetical protein
MVVDPTTGKPVPPSEEMLAFVAPTACKGGVAADRLPGEEADPEDTVLIIPELRWYGPRSAILWPYVHLTRKAAQA